MKLVIESLRNTPNEKRKKKKENREGRIEANPRVNV